MARVLAPPQRAAAFVAWGNASLLAATDPDTASEAVRGRDSIHYVLGLPGSPDDVTTLPVALRVLARDGATGFRLVLPVSGDVYGLPGPSDFNAAAVLAREAVIVGGLAVGLVPEVAALDEGVEVTWTSHLVLERPNPMPSLSEAERALSGVLREATEVLAALDIARLDDDAAQVLAALRSGAFDGPRLPAGHPARANDVVVRARRLAAIVALARLDDGMALTAAEAARRREALDPIDRAARQALCAAYSAAHP